nr:nasp-related protein sim3 [Quercus suber]
MSETIPEQISPQELAAKLEQLKASATQQYSLKNYNAAAEFFSEAAEAQDELNGEMSPANADLLYQYGRCLYHVAVSNSDVLGGKVASAEEPKRKKRKTLSTEGSASAATTGGGLVNSALENGQQRLAEEVVGAVAEEKHGVKPEGEAATKPYFQITGDENFTDSEDDDDDADPDAEEEDDFATAYEILDMARVLLARNVESAQDHAGKSTTENPEVRQLQERLADTHDLQAEISLENERFHDAISDTRSALLLKLELYPQESSLVAEAHFKLSLALEFASVTSTSGEGEAEVAQVDENLRGEAAEEMTKAIASCQSRVSKEEEALTSLDAAKQEERKKVIADVKEMVLDMEQRLVDLRNPAVSLNGITGPAGAPDGSDPLRGVLGQLLGESKGEQQKRIADATAQANDLSGMVKRKKPKTEESVAGVQGKRKAEDPVASDTNGKKAKVEDA